ncbi:uncharacterized protein B0J16DRAFT_318011 [Fusarium flagelliforme]|uniref:Uncharacterized protein n=1 Tax=Fusarium flagelliforme TaxID=2675880 RepID=A0A395MBW2_9HYPO|nr:uncharacterized protein B0J16DRAFT_318011 [Fusarium flagelliforme]KAH7188341.1 hypothetical protein B0J16DRAFT_318011 [Fusarium flagelliforme]RFN45407.1 hypothetical protein FIE12Z_10381 [Fusarium flagelliforme]
MPAFTSPSLDPKVIFASCYRKGPRCIGNAKSKGRTCDRSIGQAKMVQHNNHMMKLNSLPLRKRAESPVLVEATRLLLCHDHIPSDLSCELEKAKQKFRDAADAEAKNEDEDGTKKPLEDQREADEKEDGVTPTPPATPQVKDEYPSQSDSESNSDSKDEDEDKGTGTVDP